MMKQKRSIFIGWHCVMLALVGLLFGLLELAYCQDSTLQPFAEQQPREDGTVLLLQQTNPEAGTVTPSTGVHYFGLNTEVTLTAIPKAGYYFLYWMGDVTDPTANNTIVYLDTPKIVIAVFERSEFELPEEEVQNTMGGGGGKYPSPADYSRAGGGSGGRRPFEFDWPQLPDWNPPEPPEIPDEFPIPEPEEESDEFPVPHLPEPATALLLGLGGLLFVRRGTKR